MMNEQIRELMKQAGELAYEEHKANCLKNGVNPMMPYGNNLAKTFEKFAELIVRECANKVDWILAEGGKTQGDLIKEHFGVEE